MSNKFFEKAQVLETSLSTRSVPLSNATSVSKVTSQQLQGLLKIGMLEVAYLKSNNQQISNLLESNESNHKELNATLSKFISNQGLSLVETRNLGNQLSEFSSEIFSSNRDFKNSLSKLNLEVLSVMKTTDAVDANREQLLSVLSNMDKELEIGLRRDERILDVLGRLDLNKRRDESKPETSKGLGMFDLVKSVMKSPLASLLPMLSTGGSIVGGVAGAFGLKKLMNFIPFFGGKKPPKLLEGGANPNLSFVEKEGKFANLGKKFGKVLKPLKMLGKFAGFVGLALTAKDIYDNTVEEFFGKDSKQTTMSEKIRNVITKTLSGLISDLSFGLLDSTQMKKAFDGVADTIMSMGSKIGTSIASITGTIWDAVKSLLPDSIKKLLPSGTPEVVKSVVDAGNSLFSKGSEVLKKATGTYEQPEDQTKYDKGFAIAASASTQTLNENYRNRGQVKFNVSDNVSGATKGSLKGQANLYGKCYLAVGKVLAKYDPTMDKQLNNGFSTSAYQFADYASTPEGKQRLIRVSASKYSQNLGIEPGDIIVYPKNYERDGGHKHGHIEIMGNDGNTYSDYTDKGAQLLHRHATNGDLDNGFVKVFRLKGAQQKIKSKQQEVATKKDQKGSNPVAKLDQTQLSMKEKAFKGLSNNEVGSNKQTAYKISHAIKGASNFSFGQSQFDIGQRPDAWKKLGFSDEQIKKMQEIGKRVRKVGSIDKLSAEDQAYYKSMQGQLKGKEGLIDQLDQQENESLYSNYEQDKNGIFKGLDVSDPQVMAQMVDIYNQHGRSAFRNESTVTKKNPEAIADKLKRLSGGTKVTVEALKQWRLTSGADKSDQLRRYANINNEFKDMGVAKVPTKSMPVASKSKEMLQADKISKAKKEMSKNESKQAPLVVSPVNNNVASNPVNKVMGIGDENLILVNLGLF